jgi:hypothetical protein
LFLKSGMSKCVRKSISLPGLLWETICKRFAEFGYTSFSPYAVELVCYDLRTGARHTITAAIARDSLVAQDAVDHELVRTHRPGYARNGLLVQFIERMQGLAEGARGTVRGVPMSVHKERITFPGILWPVINQRWQELEYPSFSSYITGLVRYDLMVGGNHSFTASDCDPEITGPLDRATLKAAQRPGKKKTFLDYLIERTNGRKMTHAELAATKEQVALLLRKSVAVKQK